MATRRYWAHDPLLSDERLAKARGRIDHVIVLMLENRSFDHLLGFHPIPGLAPLEPSAHVNPLDPNNASLGGEPPSAAGAHILTKDPPHSHHSAKQQMGQVLRRERGTAVYAMNGFADAYRAKLLNKEHLPVFRWRRIWGALIVGGAVIAGGLWQLAREVLNRQGVVVLIYAMPAFGIAFGLVWRKPLYRGLGKGKAVLAVFGGGLILTAVIGTGDAVVHPHPILLIPVVAGAFLGGLAARRVQAGDAKKRRPVADPEQMTQAARAIMHCIPLALSKVLGALAAHFAYCTAWHASVPGATWPNRNFLHAGTSAQSVDIEVGLYGDRTIFEVLEGGAPSGSTPWRIYFDGMPQVIAFENLLADERANNWRDISRLFDDIANETLPTYAFVEPRHDHGPTNSLHPGNNQTGTGGSSDFARGEELVQRVYAALLAKPKVFERTLLLINFDEHGGFFDHVSPPATVHPARASSLRHPQSATRRLVAWFVEWKNAPFDFKQLGMRVPSIIVSPWVDPGPVPHTFDHTSLIATLREMFVPGAKPLGRRDKQARPFWDLVVQRDTPRTDLPVIPPPRYPPEPEAGAAAAIVAQPPPATPTVPAPSAAIATGHDLADQLDALAPRLNTLLTERGAPPPPGPPAARGVVSAAPQAPTAPTDVVAARLAAWTR